MPRGEKDLRNAFFAWGWVALVGLLAACQPAAPLAPPTPVPPTAARAPTALLATPAALPTATRPPAPSPTPTRPPTATPQPAATQTATPSPGVTFASVEGALLRGTARVSVQTAPGAACSIVYLTPAGTASRAQGLESRTADAQGQVSWSWTISSNTRPGTGRVTVTCEDESQTAPIRIG